jgi:acyl-CoA thioester hydrolase
VRVPIEPRFADYDLQGHVNNSIYLTYFEIARHRAWRSLCGEASSFPFIIAEAQVRYVSQARLGDPLAVDITTAEVRNKAWVWSYRVVDTRDERLVAEGRTVQVMYDYAEQRTIPIPEHLKPILTHG